MGAGALRLNLWLNMNYIEIWMDVLDRIMNHLVKGMSFILVHGMLKMVWVIALIPQKRKHKKI